jgi:hypothetical protein
VVKTREITTPVSDTTSSHAPRGSAGLDSSLSWLTDSHVITSGKSRLTASRWRRGEIFAAKISEGQQAVTEGADADLSEHEEGERFGRNEKEKAKLREERNAAKQMEATYWLEMVDSKHRCVFPPPVGPPELAPDLFRRSQLRVESQVVPPEVE